MWQKRNANHYWTAGSYVEAHVKPERRADHPGYTWGWEIVRNGKTLRKSLPALRDLRDAQRQATDCMILYDEKIEESLQANKIIQRKNLADQVMAKLRSG